MIGISYCTPRRMQLRLRLRLLLLFVCVCLTHQWRPCQRLAENSDKETLCHSKVWMKVGDQDTNVIIEPSSAKDISRITLRKLISITAAVMITSLDFGTIAYAGDPVEDIGFLR